MPVVPADYLSAAAALGANIVAIECNSGAERVIALVPPGWDDDWTDAQLAETIALAAR